MNHYLNRFKQKIKYNSIYRIILDGLAKINIHIKPYYLVLEGLSDKPLPQFKTNFHDYNICFLGLKDMKDIAAIPDQARSEKELIQRLNQGNKCLGVKKNNRLVAYTWCDLENCRFKWRSFKLSSDEAYLFDAYTLIEFRGLGLAPFIRYQLYKELLKLNRTKLYSISEYFNQQSINFKQKLNARFIDLGIHISLFNKWNFSSILKKYN